MRTNFKFFNENEPDISLEDLIGMVDVAVPNDYNPSYYDCEGFTFIGVTSMSLDPNGVPFKKMLFSERGSNQIIEGNIIHSHHPMWNCTDRFN